MVTARIPRRSLLTGPRNESVADLFHLTAGRLAKVPPSDEVLPRSFNEGGTIAMTRRKLIVALTGAGMALLRVTPGMAQTTSINCSDTGTLPNPVFMAGSSAFEPILASLSVQIKKSQNISIIYAPISSCSGVSAVSPPADAPTPQPLTGTAHYYTPDPTDPTLTVTNTCNLSGVTMALIGVSDASFESCQNAAKPSGIGEWFGPEQAMLIVVPKANLTTTAISAEQAAAIWGCGAKGKVAPFTNINEIFQRSSTSGTQILVARNIGVPESAFVGTGCGSSSIMLTSIVNAPDPQSTIGFIAADFYSTHRTVLNAVAFRGTNQKKAYYADADSLATDLLNVREGRYMIQGPLHFFSALTGTASAVDGGAGTPAPSAIAGRVLDWLSGAVPIDPTDTKNMNYVTTVATLGDVPQCAMRVKIAKDGGYFSPYTPPVSCHCAFEKAKSLRTSAGTCPVCMTDADCTGGLRCQTGYCE